MVGIVDYGIGNIRSVQNAFERVGADVAICSQPEEITAVERLVIPGVGAFNDCMKHLQASGMIEAIETAVFQQAKPTLGICVGMQLMATTGYENGRFSGLGWFEGDVVAIDTTGGNLRIPHVGWNSVALNSDSPLFSGMPAEGDFYFVHSYCVQPADNSVVDATVEYGKPLVAAIRKENIVATQFHPEKSQSYGLAVLENFLAWRP